MICNISNALPAIVKSMKEGNAPTEYNPVETMKFFRSILPVKKGDQCLKHMHLDCIFEFNENVPPLTITLDTLPFLKDFDYIQNEKFLLIRGSYEDLAVLSLLLVRFNQKSEAGSEK